MNERPCIVFSQQAFSKMLALIMTSPLEVGWYGLTYRDGNTYHVTDVIVYPQIVSGVRTTESSYEWRNELSDDEYNSLRCHCHSHVNMSPSPSGVDEEDKTAVLADLSEGQFYIFMIWNKSLQYTAEIYDATTMLKWETRHISLSVEGLGNIREWTDKIKKNVKECDRNGFIQVSRFF